MDSARLLPKESAEPIERVDAIENRAESPRTDRCGDTNPFDDIGLSLGTTASTTSSAWHTTASTTMSAWHSPKPTTAHCLVSRRSQPASHGAASQPAMVQPASQPRHRHNGPSAAGLQRDAHYRVEHNSGEAPWGFERRDGGSYSIDGAPSQPRP